MKPAGSLSASMIRRDPDASKVRAFWTKIPGPDGTAQHAFAIVSIEEYEQLVRQRGGEPRSAAL